MGYEIAIVLGLLLAAVGLFATRALPVDLVTIFHFQKWCSHLKAFCFELWWLSSPRARISYLGIHPRSTRTQYFY